MVWTPRNRLISLFPILSTNLEMLEKTFYLIP